MENTPASVSLSAEICPTASPRSAAAAALPAIITNPVCDPLRQRHHRGFRKCLRRFLYLQRRFQDPDGKRSRWTGIVLSAAWTTRSSWWKLAQGETFVTPEAALSYSEKGLTALSDQFQKAYHANLIRSPWKDKKRPTLVNNWEATYFGFDAEKLLKIAGGGSRSGPRYAGTGRRLVWKKKR